MDFSSDSGMRVNTLEVVWHKKEAIHAFDTCETDQKNVIRAASGGVDCMVRVWLIRNGVTCDFRVAVNFATIFMVPLKVPLFQSRPPFTVPSKNTLDNEKGWLEFDPPLRRQCLIGKC